MGLDGVCREDILVLDRRAQAANEGKVTGEVGPVLTPGEVAYLLGKSAAAVQESRDVISLCEIAARIVTELKSLVPANGTKPGSCMTMTFGAENYMAELATPAHKNISNPCHADHPRPR